MLAPSSMIVSMPRPRAEAFMFIVLRSLTSLCLRDAGESVARGVNKRYHNTVR